MHHAMPGKQALAVKTGCHHDHLKMGLRPSRHVMAGTLVQHFQVLGGKPRIQLGNNVVFDTHLYIIAPGSAHQHHGNIVVTAGYQSRIDQMLRKHLSRTMAMLLPVRLQLRIIQHVRQAVRAQQIAVAGLLGNFFHVHVHIRLQSHGSGNDVTVGGNPGFISRHEALIYHGLDHAMVPGERLHAIAVEPISAGISDVTHGKAAGTQGCPNHQRRTHVAQFPISLRVQATHAIGQHGNPEVAVEIEGIFVGRANLPRMSAANDFHNFSVKLGPIFLGANAQMLAVISPAKTLDFTSPATTRKHSLPVYLKDSTQLIESLRNQSPADIAELMHISSKLADLNYERYAQWHTPFDQDNAKQALLAFKGDVYMGLAAESYNERDFTWAQKHVRILSGLHGILKPLDLIQPYRLEMGTKLATKRGENLYDLDLDAQAGSKEKLPILINLASNEYFNAVQASQLNARVITPTFKDLKDGRYKFLTFYAKKARGLMTSYLVKNRVASLKALKAFDWEGYSYSEDLSDGDDWVFLRDHPQ